MTTSPQLRAGIYGRQSHGKETSVADQVRAGHVRCGALGAVVAKVYRDKVSASRFGNKDREEWPLLVADVAAGLLGLVWLWDASRGDRTPESWFGFLSSCRSRGVLIYSERDQRTYDVRIPRDWKTLADSGVDAAYESEIRSVDVRRGIAGAAAAGKPAGGPAPYGFDRRYDPTNPREFTLVHNEFAPVAREIIERVSKNDPIAQIARDLNSRGIPSADGGQWQRAVIRRIAMNPAYAGLREHDGTLYAGNWPGIVDRSTWEAGRSVLSQPDRKRIAPGSFRWLLSYVMVAQCGGQVHTVGRPDGRCKHRYVCQADSCTSIGLEEADEFVTRVVLARLAREDARALFASDDAEMAAALAEVAAAEVEAQELETAARAGMRPALVAAADAGIQERLKAAQARVTAASGNAAALALLGDDEFTAETARPRWDALSVAARRSVVTALVERIELLPTDVRLSRWATDEDRLALASERLKITPVT